MSKNNTNFFDTISKDMPAISVFENTINQIIGKNEVIHSKQVFVADKESSEPGLSDDELFLLSVNEYERYKNIIPTVQTRWWLRCEEEHKVAFVTAVGEAFIGQDLMARNALGVRPALRFTPDLYMENKEIGSEFSYKNRPFTKIDKDLAIATVPIGFGEFDTKTSNYLDSDIRKMLKLV